LELGTGTCKASASSMLREGDWNHIRDMITLLSPPFSKNFGSPINFQHFVKKVGTKQKDLNTFGIQSTTQYLLNTSTF
jgi:hypothetical protein